MGVQNLSNGADIERARYERNNRLNPPEFAPGQDLSPVSTGDLFGNMGGGDLFSGGGNIFDNSPQDVNVGGMSDPFGSNPFGGGMSNDPFGNSGMGGNPFGGGMSNDPFGGSFGGPSAGFNTGNTFGPSANGMMMPNQQQSGFTYDKAEAMAKSTVGGLKSIGASFTQVTPLFWFNYCKTLKWVGIGLGVLGLILALTGVGNVFATLITGFIFTFGSLGATMLMSDKVEGYTSEYKDMPQDMPMQPMMQEPMPTFDDFPQPQPDAFDFPEPTNDFDFPAENPSAETETFDLDKLEVSEPIARENPEEVINTMQEIPQGMYTRKYLYDMFTRLLPNICPDFSTLREIPESDNAFIEMELAVQEAVEVTGCKETIELQKLQENYATILVTTSRPTGLKLEATAEELAHIYAYRSSDITEEGRSRVYAKVEAVGRTCIFTIFTGKTAMISLKDMYRSVENYILDSKHYMPVVFGIDPMANVIVYDLKSLESIIVAGMPRSGKTWFVLNMITQMAAFTSPKELEFYICDPKGDISDFKPFCVPHVKKFESTDEGIMETLRYLVKVEAPRRKKMIGAGDNLTASQNIWDYKARYPDVNMSIIYVVIDEVVTLASRMEAETLKEFRAILRELISQLPALGIRAIMIPHVLKNDIIEKKTSDIVLCRISVCGDPEHVESVTGAKPKEFPFKLTMPGDMGVRIPPISQSIMYLRAPVLNATNPENRELFDYMRRVWTKLEPDSVNDSMARFAAADRDNAEVMAQEVDQLDDFDMFGTEEDSYNEVTGTFIKAMNS